MGYPEFGVRDPGTPRVRKLPWYIANARVRSRPHRRVKLLDTLTFFRQLSTLLRGGSPILEALIVAGEENESINLRRGIEQVAARVSGGQSFAQAAGNCPAVFNEYWVQLIRTGEASGNLPAVLEQLVAHLEVAQQIQSKVLGALAYPCILMFISFVGLIVMLWKVIPTFTTFFKDFGGKLPAITLFVMALSDFFVHYGVHFVIGVGSIVYLAQRYFRSEPGLRNLTNVLVVIPLVGDLMVQQAMQKFTANMALLLKSGTPMLEAIEIIQSLYLNFPAYKDAMHQVYLTVMRGAGLSDSLEGAQLFTPLLVSMVRVGESTGELLTVLQQLERYYSQRVTKLLDTVTGLIEPLVIILMGVIVGGILSAIYIPLFKMSSGSKV